LKASVETGKDMIAFANGATYKQYAKIVMESTSPYSALQTDMVVDSTTSMTTNELRGLHISSKDIILAAFFDTTTGKFQIGTINFATRQIFF
jgi:hypothetical protein